MADVTSDWRKVLSVAALSFACASCFGGHISEPLGAPEQAGASHEPAAGSGAPASVSQVFAPAPAALRKLTVEQYRNSVADLLGADIVVPSDLEPDTAQNGFFAIGAAQATVSPAAAEKFETAAYDVAAQALVPARRAALVGCTPMAAVDSSCSKQFVTKLGKRAFRRPLSDVEVTRYAGIADSAARTLNDFHAGLEFALAGLLQSPQFLFRVELGEHDPGDASRLRYSDYELASRLSYALWNSTPDAPLMAAADAGQLTSGTGLAEQADRLLADARAKSALDNFHAERLGLADLATLEKSSAVYANLDDTLRSALRDDVLRTLAEYTYGKDQDFLASFESKLGFANSALAQIYGASFDAKGSATQQIMLPEAGARVGILGKPAFLALNAHANETSPTLRGKYIRERFLCQSIPAPPPNVVPVLGPVDPNAPTMRQRLQAHASDASCATCHNQMDPLGLALEHFDAIGRYRDDDQGHALDTHGELDGKSFDGSVALSALLRDDPRAAACVVRQLYRYNVAHIETAGEQPQIAALVAKFEASGHALCTLVRDVVLSDGFRYAARQDSQP
jgi:Protein of unknown function (DUF1588)/Protein of unknown function (DUF1592)/Protein of unknown function (DUF1595)/Protein of unknown function (DUF1587)/Protein of unknown function (DUF1585)